MELVIIFIVCAAIVLLPVWLRWRFVSFRGQAVDEYQALGPELDPQVHLAGPLLCEGVIYGPTGRVTSRFVAKMMGTWSDGKGILTEDFVYDSGIKQRREWRIELDGQAMRAEADDVKGQSRGWLAGPALRMRYKIVLPPEDGGHVLDAVDWMYLLDNGTLVNRSQFRKFGILAAELVATIRKDETA
ncbi:DUF3833 family protein [Profundibacterium mesophilum]|uniref:DUF3833 domain-containing protein n=1 Tax=Profundibacterium mesophilum KAUST100406-0324 TaxID=1037889 RepID=A0A921NWF2_9RHOB|nr:DUF3833 family protein [Profundibacterium mesophilum]KAF0676586.1 hypothetical protein PMES_01318 [Profundibacterium mesophilum KAUST100406-0324]